MTNNENSDTNESFDSSDLLSAAVSRITDAVADTIYVDPHQWSRRPCATCKVITALIGKPFGCDRFREVR